MISFRYSKIVALIAAVAALVAQNAIACTPGNAPASEPGYVYFFNSLSCKWVKVKVVEPNRPLFKLTTGESQVAPFWEKNGTLNFGQIQVPKAVHQPLAGGHYIGG
jgi:hypothetical protein